MEPQHCIWIEMTSSMDEMAHNEPFDSILKSRLKFQIQLLLLLLF